MASLRFFCTTNISAVSTQHKVNNNNKCVLHQKVKNLINNTLELPSISSSSSSTTPIESLHKGNWVKLICGASFEDVVDIRNLSLVYTLAGVDCIDCAADASVVSAVNEGIEAARDILCCHRRPWVMISVNDDKDLHFRKAEFDPEDCPADCSRPCENVCPANAISFQEKSTLGISYNTEASRVMKDGVITERCYGCGRCLPVCPYDKIREVTYVRDAITTSDLIKRNDVDAIEIHTSGRQSRQFEELWRALGDSVQNLKLVAVSLPNVGDSTISSMNKMFSIMKPNLESFNLWQLDGRPMSGDIGRGATKESIAFAVQLAQAKDRPPGFLQLAGGTNAHTIEGLKREGLFQTTISPSNPSCALISGIAYGGYARKIVGRVLRSMQSQHGGAASIEDHPEHLLMALREALALVGPVKCL
ncbi:4Fe-4S ferredoxin - iron-sulfur binding protein [Trifolium pratense]|uniref:4Fe-4S ferredoxin-iron-sulfur binding protein n=1 Tax=Trifolium pratense TaxID=57577 RepID=A0A2K3N1K7_TRIPR|nr:4Fe-4S ferredoxin - iron-sulfur binding protein [Trifolium pratense]